MSTMRWAGGAFTDLHRTLMGPPIDWTGFDLERFESDHVRMARAVWAERAQSEFRSIQILNRFLGDVLAAGDPLDVYAGAADLVADEIRHANLCAEVCRHLGIHPKFPDPVAEKIPVELQRAPAPDRALTTAISMLAVSETLSVGFISDLAARCDTPGIRDVLRRTIEDESTHDAFGWAYVRASLGRYPPSTLRDWRHLVNQTLEPHRQAAARALAQAPSDRRTLDAVADPAFTALGLFSPARQALVFEKTVDEVLRPQLLALELWP